MSQTFPAAADLGPLHTGKSIGYRVLNLDRTTYSAFSATGVSESIAGMGYYVKSGGAVGPDAGGYIVWGTSGTDIIEDEILPASPTVSQIDTELSDNHGAGSWATATGFATQTNVSDAQTAIASAISALNNLSQAQAQNAATAALNAYDPPTKAELDAAVASLNNLSGSDILALSVETGHSLQVVLRALYALIRGKSRTDDPDAPTYFEYLAPDDTTVRVRHDISEDGTTRSVTVG